ncbi:MAG: hypothetical protein A2388_03265 [Candidatus Veblenbacteria bacterium RIFOXYB1_FULL_43_13]|uniref:Fibronectin type-III domain-containing protein n=1 Tax=Candidatus Veblenbacteria bacterium RIFOXYB1_FULL_43_13 TaxID=1802426 RepID=A0A1G2Q380_9BACT|nr:MAG: hypothetical protein A2388_03265 [Candidatus Veblenbacteria bacterium RIFOXYB1_FULL_43_13]
MKLHKLSSIIIAILIFVSWLPQAVSAQLIIDRITVKTKTNDKGGVIGMQISFYTSLPTTSRIDYGTTTDYGFFNGSSIYNTYHEVVLVNLKSDTTYHYRITVTTSQAEQTSTLDYTFKTGKVVQPAGNQVAITDVNVTNVGGTYFVVTWKTTGQYNGEIRYNTVENFVKPAKVKAVRSGNQYEVVVGKLKLNTKYYWQAYVSDKDGNTGTSSVQTITTAVSSDIKVPLVISEISPASQADLRLTDTTAVVRWRTNLPAKADVSLKATERRVKGGGKIKEGLYATEHEVIYINLIPNKSYVFTIAARDIHGKKVSTGQFGFITKATHPAPQVAGSSTSCYRAGWTYQQCRNLTAERAKALELKQNLNKKFNNRVPASALRNWYTLVNAYTYGGYPLEAIVAAVKHGGKTVHPTIGFFSWQNSKDYKDYIKK